MVAPVSDLQKSGGGAGAGRGSLIPRFEFVPTEHTRGDIEQATDTFVWRLKEGRRLREKEMGNDYGMRRETGIKKDLFLALAFGEMMIAFVTWGRLCKRLGKKFALAMLVWG